jgi:pimeloyl-ACP methyl ester carboxylesterase
VIPVHFGERHRPLFGVYDPSLSPRRDIGVVILNPTGWEAIRAHRTLRSLALRLARTGFDVFRFDYSGTGDSWGDARSDASAAQWLRDIDDAIEELQGLAGVQRVVLIGLRLGSRLALEAASHRATAIYRLVLWDPSILPDAVEPDEESTAAPPTTDSDWAMLDTPDTVLRDLAKMNRRSTPGVTVQILSVMSNGQSLPDDLPDACRIWVQTDTESPPCWIEEGDTGAGAVPTRLLERMVQWLTA